MYSPQKILLLDDNRDLLQIVQIILKGQGYETVLASSIEEAILKIKVHKPVLILMDVCLSDQDGYTFCNKIKNTKYSIGNQQCAVPKFLHQIGEHNMYQ